MPYKQITKASQANQFTHRQVSQVSTTDFQYSSKQSRRRKYNSTAQAQNIRANLPRQQVPRAPANTKNLSRQEASKALTGKTSSRMKNSKANIAQLHGANQTGNLSSI